MKELAEFKCRICEKQHSKLNELIGHLSKEHKCCEMPYRCDACGFRTSFYADAIFHIKKVNILLLLKMFILKIIVLWTYCSHLKYSNSHYLLALNHSFIFLLFKTCIRINYSKIFDCVRFLINRSIQTLCITSVRTV